MDFETKRRRGGRPIRELSQTLTVYEDKIIDLKRARERQTKFVKRIMNDPEAYQAFKDRIVERRRERKKELGCGNEGVINSLKIRLSTAVDSRDTHIKKIDDKITNIKHNLSIPTLKPNVKEVLENRLRLFETKRELMINMYKERIDKVQKKIDLMQIPVVRGKNGRKPLPEECKKVNVLKVKCNVGRPRKPDEELRKPRWIKKEGVKRGRPKKLKDTTDITNETTSDILDVTVKVLEESPTLP